MDCAHGDQVVFSDGSKILGSDWQERLRPTRSGNKLNFEKLWRMNKHNSAKIPALQPMLGDVARQ